MTHTHTHAHTHIWESSWAMAVVPLSLQPRRLTKTVHFPSFVNVESFSFCSKGNGCSKVQWHQTPALSGRCGYPVTVTHSLMLKPRSTDANSDFREHPLQHSPFRCTGSNSESHPRAREWRTAQLEIVYYPWPQKSLPLLTTSPFPRGRTVLGKLLHITFLHTNRHIHTFLQTTINDTEDSYLTDC